MSLLWLLSCGLSALAQSQQRSATEAPETQGSAGQQAPEQQLPGTIRGMVVDGTGAVVVGAEVTLTREDQALNQKVLSGRDGQFSFVNVRPGTFQVTIQAAGFAPQTSSGILHSGELYNAPTSTLSPATANTAVQVVATLSELAEDQVKVQEKQRVIGMVPNFYVSYIPDAIPLSPRQKFELAWRTMVDPATFVLTGVAAGVQHAQDAFSGYGQGAAGYAKRFAASYGDNLTETFIGSAFLPSLLKQDPRYFYKGTGSKGSRVLYAIGNLAVCKGDNKHWQPNYSGLLGTVAAGGISTLYYPAKDRGAGLVFENAVSALGTGAALNLLQEFVIRKLTPNAPHHEPAKP